MQLIGTAWCYDQNNDLTEQMQNAVLVKMVMVPMLTRDSCYFINVANFFFHEKDQFLRDFI